MRMRMHGWRGAGEERKREARHMCTVPPRGSAVIAPIDDGGGASPSSSPNSASFFCKDGRKISVGDCALFKPPQDTPPFIGLIRSVNSDRENKLKLIVNWLYRPSEVKLGKGFLLESAPNEIFYSFHKDEIPAASILHPCKVAFLPKSVELPSGIGSFVCRRVYDITNRCLWWLTDQDYINERQEEVDQLLYKTRLEMHATIPPGGRSPRPANGPTSTSQLKSGSESVQNSPSFPSQGKGKKRERGDQGFESVKRERGSKAEDGEPGHSRTESNLKSEIAKITEKGGLVDYEGVEKLVQLMLPERNEKKIDLVSRSILAGVVAATDKFDCLNWFVQLKGLPVFDDWLQHVHKGKIGDGSSPRDGDKSVEEFLLILLRALDKLPVNLHALQMCNIGKSVNHLRTHKNLDIQKKARSLVDTWKKRVEAEMDAKSGSNQGVSWPTRPRLPEVPQGTNKQPGGTNEVAIKSIVSQPAASKTSSVNLVQGETTTRSAFASPGSLKSAPLPASVVANLKDGQHRNVAATDLSAPVKDEKSSSSSQSHNSSQSSSDHAKTGDARSSTAGSKTSAGSSRSRKSVNGFPGSSISAVQKETGSNRSSTVYRSPASERLSQSNSTCEKAHDLPMVEGNNHKLIVKIPNRGRSPAQSASGGSFEDPSVTNSRSSSPVLSEKQDQSDNAVKEKSETFRPNISSNMSSGNDVKDTVAVSGNGEGSPPVLLDGKGCKIGDDTKKVVEVANAASSSSGHELKAVRLHEASLSSINALIDSCVKYSETNVSMAAGDDIGMNLLASVAAGEMSKSEIVSPTDSPVANKPLCDHCSDDIDSRAKSSAGADVSRVQCHSAVGVDEGPGINTISGKNMGCAQEKPAMVLNGSPYVSPMDLQQTGDSCVESNQNSSKLVMACEDTSDGAGENLEEKIGSRVDGITDTKRKIDSSLLTQANMSGAGAVTGSLSPQTLENKVENEKNMSEGLNDSMQTDLKPTQSAKREDKDMLHLSDPSKEMASEKIDEVKAEKGDEAYGSNHDESECKSMDPMNPEDQVVPHPASNVASCKFEQLENNREGDETKQLSCVRQALSKASPVSKFEEANQHARLKLTGSERDRAEESKGGTAESSFSAARVSKVEFDLNEDCDVEDGKIGELSNLKATGSAGFVQKFISPLPFPVSSSSSSLPASITVAAAAKGPFVPPEDLLRSKGALGWKGSAATSAFRPAEPRKVLEMPLAATNISLSDAATGKQSRPLLDIDLNVPDERILEDLASRSSAQDTVSVSFNTIIRDGSRDELVGCTPARFSVLDLDLNRVGESTVNVNNPTSNSRRINASVQPVASPSGALSHGEMNVRRDFDLNDGPVTDEVTTEPSIFNQHNRSIPFQPPVSGVRINNAESGNLSSWFPRSNTYSTITVPSVLPDRGEQPFSVVTPVGPQRMPGGTPFGPDFYRAPVLSSSPAMPFPSTQFQYPVFPFGTSFPPNSATFSGGSTTYVDTSSGGRLCFPAVNSQFLGPVGAVSSHYPRPPYVVSLTDGSNTAHSENSWKWGKQGLDLNAGPGVPDMEGRDENSSLVPRQLSVANSQALAEEQARMYQLAGGLLKRKEPEGGWDGYKRPSWQ